MRLHDDLTRSIDRLEAIKAGLDITEGDYSMARATASQAQVACAELVIEMAETLNDMARTGPLCRRDRNNIRATYHDAFFEAVEAADIRAAERRVA